MAEEVCEKEKLICSIQGLTSVCAKHYLAYIPSHLYHKLNLSVLFRKTLWGQKRQLERRGAREIRTLKYCKNIIGRTDWDYACSYFINPERCYYKCNETLRNEFYNNCWKYEKCEKYSIFVSQGSSPLKGLNVLIQAMGMLIAEYPEIKLYIAGNNFIANHTMKQRMMVSVYGSYIRRLLKQEHLVEKVVFLGQLDAEEMCKAYLRANVFVSASSIENSSNSIGEAMLLGMPVISSYVGGVNSLVTNNLEGLLYQGNAPYMLAMKIKEFFDQPQKAIEMGLKARKRAKKTHDPQCNSNNMINIYKNICKNKG